MSLKHINTLSIMKNSLALILLMIAMSAGAQSGSEIYFLHSYGGGNSDIQCLPSGTNYVAQSTIGDGTATIYFANNSWVVSGLSTGTEYTTNSIEYPTNGQYYVLYSNGTNVVSSFYGNCTLTFYYFSEPTTTLVNQSLTGLFLNSGDQVAFSYSGTVSSNTGTNGTPLVVSVNQGTLFTTPAFNAIGGWWNLTGTLIPTGTNLAVAIQYTSSDTNNPGGGTNYIFSGFNSASNTLYVYDQCGQCGQISLTNASLTSPNLSPYDANGAWKQGTNGYPWMTNATGVVWPSNTWSLAAITNSMTNGGFWLGDSNGLALTAVWMSNGVVRLKQLAP